MVKVDVLYQVRQLLPLSVSRRGLSVFFRFVFQEVFCKARDPLRTGVDETAHRRLLVGGFQAHGDPKGLPQSG